MDQRRAPGVRAAISGWPIVGWSALAIALMIATLLVRAGTGEDGIRLVIRATARTSVVLFTLAFAASAIRSRWPTPTSAWLLANRRYFGVSFAVSHGAHLLAILALADWSLVRFVVDSGPAAVIGGGIAYVLLAAMTATSFDRTAAWLGARRWKRLHTVGAYYLWGIFFLSYAPRAVLESPLFYGPFALALLAALGLRLSARRAAPWTAVRPVTAPSSEL